MSDPLSRIDDLAGLQVDRDCQGQTEASFEFQHCHFAQEEVEKLELFPEEISAAKEATAEKTSETLKNPSFWLFFRILTDIYCSVTSSIDMYRQKTHYPWPPYILLDSHTIFVSLWPLVRRRLGWLLILKRRPESTADPCRDQYWWL